MQALPFADLNWLAVLVATLTNMVWGMVWYTPLLFGRKWMGLAHPGKTEEDLAKGPKTPYLIALGGAFVVATALALLLHALDATTIPEGLLVAAVVWVGFIATTFAQAYAFGGKPLALWAIDSGFNLPVLLTMAAILVAWP